MAGNRQGGFKAAEKNKKLHGADFYQKIGRMGGSVTGVKKGFAANHQRAVEAGRKGGLKSRRGPAKRKGDD